MTGFRCYLCWLNRLNDHDLYFRYVDWSKAQHSKDCPKKHDRTAYRLVTKRLKYEENQKPNK
jgi:hypothetical protein